MLPEHDESTWRISACELFELERYDIAMFEFYLLAQQFSQTKDWYSTGFCALALGRFDKSFELFSTLWNENPHILKISTMNALLLATSPIAHHRNGKKSLEISLSKLKTNEHNWELLSVIAAAYAEVGDFPSAIEFARLALKKCPASSGEQNQRRICQYQQSRPARLTAAQVRRQIRSKGSCNRCGGNTSISLGPLCTRCQRLSLHNLTNVATHSSSSELEK